MAEPEEEEEGSTPFDGAGEQEYDEDDLPEVIDLSGVQATEYTIVPKGRYQGYIDEIEYGLSQSKGLPMLTFICKFDYQGPEDEEPKERTLRYYATLAGDGAGRTKALLAKLDPEIDMSQLRPDDLSEELSGLDVWLNVTVRPDRENRRKKRNNITDIDPLDEDEE